MKDIFIKAREYLTEPRRWARGNMFVDQRGLPTRCDKASAMCLQGAVSFASGGRGTPEGRDAYDAAINALEALVGSLPTFNDNATHQEVLDALDRAILAS